MMTKIESAEESAAVATMETEKRVEMNVAESPFCRELRSKKFFILDGLATEADHYLDGSNHCWCRQTQYVIGPDGNKVGPNRCGPSRSCYRSALAAETV